MSLQAGTATDELGNQLPIFTNSAGRFVLDGVAAGQYQITLGKWVGKVLISDDSPILIYSDDLIMQSKEDFND
ncbi:hypothetical protein JCM19233_1817 [Vibrio astriarenae]|nr:hypothetical protein JCM19233_1817 [Vibrio sp. C7]